MYNFKILDFEGPLDLLLHLIKEDKMDIMNIEIVSLTNQYLSYIENMESLNIVVASEYLTLASELIYLKSRYLLPSDKKDEEDEEFINAKENLINRLIEYKNYKEMTGVFKELEEKRQEVFTKVPSSLKEYETNSVKVSDDITLDDLLKAFSKYLERKKYLEPLSTKVTTREMSVEERSYEIRTLLKTRKKVEFFDLFDNISKPYVVITFLSILEMAKNKEFVITQENNFDKIYCEVA
ncbi:MAG: segregation/condensation protein A [bacterium]|nr:segregation/condensation protein A [bacterium]